MRHYQQAFFTHGKTWYVYSTSPEFTSGQYIEYVHLDPDGTSVEEFIEQLLELVDGYRDTSVTVEGGDEDTAGTIMIRLSRPATADEIASAAAQYATTQAVQAQNALRSLVRTVRTHRDTFTTLMALDEFALALVEETGTIPTRSEEEEL